MNPWIKRAAISFVIPYAMRKFQERQRGQQVTTTSSRRPSWRLPSGASGRTTTSTTRRRG